VRVSVSARTNRGVPELAVVVRVLVCAGRSLSVQSATTLLDAQDDERAHWVAVVATAERKTRLAYHLRTATQDDAEQA
jgi:hypothetical protein